ncbi:hypothetical protein D2E95_09495 [Mycobacteroides abscessus]|nr:hypothetical protein D2E95_09495 [Mycobacteroides abscessus]RIU52479.1 hypothetical protein D2F02_05540 [Mycobacteroides abscessus]
MADRAEWQWSGRRFSPRLPPEPNLTPTRHPEPLASPRFGSHTKEPPTVSGRGFSGHRRD